MAAPFAEIGRGARLRFTDELNLAAVSQGKSGIAQAVDSENTTLVFTLLGGPWIETDYQARAILAEMTTTARQAPILVESGASPMFEVSDFVALLGFKRLVISNGVDYAYQVVVDNAGESLEAEEKQRSPC